MAKLHELLAVESNLKSQAAKATADLLNTFEKKRHHFSESLKTFKPKEEDAPSIIEEQLDLQTTVPKEIDWLTPFMVKALDASYQVAEANTGARADVVLEDGTMLLSNIPATALLELEKRAKETHDFIAAIPTLDPAKGFRESPERGPDTFKARDVVKTRTKKENKVVTLSPATDKHPAQVTVIPEDVPIGDIVVQEWSGLITTARKGELLERVEDLGRAVKQARSRANEIDVDTVKNKIGKKLLDYIFGD